MSPPPDRLRLDVWLWHARFAKTRALASAMITAGAVRLERGGQVRRVEKPATAVAIGDRLALSAHGQIWQIEVVALGTRRGPASEARGLYNDLTRPLDGEGPTGHLPRAAVSDPERS